MHAWRKHLPFSGPRIDKGPQETMFAYKKRTEHTWGLMEWVADTCTRCKVDKLLIEAKAVGDLGRARAPQPICIPSVAHSDLPREGG